MAEARRPRELRDAESLRGQLVSWIGEQVEEAGARGAVLGLSGGVDSAVVCGLAAATLGPERCLTLSLPIESLEIDARLAAAVAERFGVPHLRIDLGQPFLGLIDVFSALRERAEREGRSGRPLPERNPAGARSNVKPRLRMVALYYFANLLDYLVIGTSNRDERVVGYFTKWGDAAADVVPLGDLLKDEVRALARLLGVPQEVIDRPPTAGLWPGQTDEEEMGLRYADIDAFLLRGTSGDPLVDEKIRMAEAASRHKRNPPPLARPE